jgi:hypothetical protein
MWEILFRATPLQCPFMVVVGSTFSTRSVVTAG